MKHQSLVGYASVVEREGDVVCTGREGWVVDHGKSPVFNVRVHMKDAIIVCVCNRQRKMCTSDLYKHCKRGFIASSMWQGC